ncbi:hydantoinase B/oxoprolinase family protein [Roseomonas sp. CAU 1739]|uniref:hydantoinase B/oxoprolinase family protein n=1 Tax=Roseomonas sp. CAU 1739 TaxID=3140364 RepID=UPI00325C1AF0
MTTDALTVAVIRAKLLAVAEEVVEVMARTAFSPLLNQSRDFSTAVLDAHGRLLAQAERVPIHMGALPFAVEAVRYRFGDDASPGDVFLLNDPYDGGSHLPDFTFCQPVFAEGALRFWVVNRAHQGDIGGISPGGYSPQATEIWHEGLRIPPLRFVTQGRMTEGILDLICLNSRMPQDTRGDVLACLASLRAGAARLDALVARYGSAVATSSCEAILEAGERAMRQEIAAWPDGVYHGESALDPPAPGATPITVRAQVTLSGSDVEVDLTGSDDQVASFLNSSRPNTMAAVNVAFMYLSATQDARNQGSSRPLTIRTRLGSLVDPIAPAPVTACTTLTASTIIEAVMRAMATAAPDRVLCGFARRFRIAIKGEGRDGRPFLWHHFSNRGGAGANAGEDGWTNLGVVHSPGGNPSPSVEQTEANYPFTVESYLLRANSGGAGQFRGGLGGSYVLRYDGASAALVTPTGDGVAIPPYGLAGGLPGLPNSVAIEHAGCAEPLDAKSGTRVLHRGDRFIHHAAGGGGYGDPARRDPDRAARDRQRGYCDPSSEGATA